MVAERPGEADALTLGQAARLLRMSPRTIRRWIQNGRIPGLLVGDEVQLLRSDIEAIARGVDRFGSVRGG